MSMALVALVAIAATPLTLWLVAYSARGYFNAVLAHMAATERLGEPAALAKERLDLEAAKVKLQEAVANEITARRQARTLDVNS